MATDIQDNLPWYGIQLFGLKQKDMEAFLKEKGVESFVPMQMVDYVDREGKRRHDLRPVVSNLIFIKKDFDEKAFAKEMERYQGHYYIIRKTKGSQEYYEIPARQMHEFMVMCNPDLLMKKYMSEAEAKLKKGDRVEVTHGPLKGMTGRLVRQSGKYYLLKEIPGMAVMIKVTRWCCAKVEDAASSL